jgi:post-segregation antitoxin (ccd killing protein)
MGKQVTVTAKIPIELKKKLARLGVNVSGLTRKALEREAKRLERERLRRLAEEAGEILQKVPAEEIVKSIREDRDKR